MRYMIQRRKELLEDYKKTLREHRIPFDVGYDRTENKEVLEILQEINDIKQHPEKYKTYNSTEEMFEDVLK